MISSGEMIEKIKLTCNIFSKCNITTIRVHKYTKKRVIGFLQISSSLFPSLSTRKSQYLSSLLPLLLALDFIVQTTLSCYFFARVCNIHDTFGKRTKKQNAESASVTNRSLNIWQPLFNQVINYFSVIY